MYDLSRSRKRWGFNYLALFVAIALVVLISYLLFLGLYNQSRQGYDTRLDPDSFVEAQDKENNDGNTGSNTESAPSDNSNTSNSSDTNSVPSNLDNTSE